jgi:hypothetical protein
MQDDDLTREEREALAALPRERDPGPLLEERTVRVLRERGMLGHGGRVVRAPAWPAFSPAWASAAAAAAVALFVSGFAVGHWIQARHTEDLLVRMHERDAAHTAALVQRTGSAYVAALAALADAADSSRAGTAATGREVAQGREVAVNILHAAANQLVRIAPEEPLAARILQGLDRVAPRDSAATEQQVIWF